MSEPLSIVLRGLATVVAVWVVWWTFLVMAGIGNREGLGYLGLFLGGPLAVVVSVVVLVVTCVRAVHHSSRPR